MPDETSNDEQIELDVFLTGGGKVNIKEFRIVRVDEGCLFVDLDGDEVDAEVVRGCAGFAPGMWSHYLFTR